MAGSATGTATLHPPGTPNPPEPPPPFLSTLETILKVAAVALGIVTALGLPAVTLQFKHLSVPMTFLPREQAVRAGVLPTIVLSILLLFAYKSLRHIQSGRRTDAGIVIIVISLLFGIAAAGQLVYLAYHVLGKSQPVFPSLPKLVVNIVGFGLTVGVRALFELMRERRWDKRLRDLMERAVNWYVRLDIANNWVIVTIVVSVSAFVFSVACAGVLKVNGILPFDLRQVLFVACSVCGTVAMLVLIFSGSEQAKVQDERISRRGKRIVISTLTILFISMTTGYSIVYPNIPYAIGGGKPSRVIAWIEKKSLPPNIGVTGIPAGADLVQFESYLIYAGSEFLIFSTSDGPNGRSFVIPRVEIQAVASPN